MNLLITGAWRGADEYMEKLRQMGHEIFYFPCEKEALPCTYEWAEGVIGNGIFLYHPIEKFINLKYIQLTSAGMDRVPMDYVREHGIEIHSASGVYSIPMAEFAVLGVLELYKKAAFFFENQRAHRWEKHRNLLELTGKTVCIVGCGSVGTECAKRFGAFGCRVIGIATRARRQEYFDKVHAVNQLGPVLREADVLILAVPLTEETRHLIDETRFSEMKQGAILVNIARGSVIVQEALEKALENRLGGAVLDVYEEEPLHQDSTLWDRENVVLFPHNSFVGENNKLRLGKIVLENLDFEKRD